MMLIAHKFRISASLAFPGLHLLCDIACRLCVFCLEAWTYALCTFVVVVVVVVSLQGSSLCIIIIIDYLWHSVS